MVSYSRSSKLKRVISMHLVNLVLFPALSLCIKNIHRPHQNWWDSERKTVQCTRLAKEGACKFFNICHFSTLIIECSH